MFDSKKTRPTEPVYNILRNEPDYLDFYNKKMLKYYSIVENHIEKHKEIFGKQTYCWTGSNKHWVWDFDKWRVYVNNIQGVSIEFTPFVHPEEAKTIIEEYWKKLNI